MMRANNSWSVVLVPGMAVSLVCALSKATAEEFCQTVLETAIDASQAFRKIRGSDVIEQASTGDRVYPDAVRMPVLRSAEV